MLFGFFLSASFAIFAIGLMRVTLERWAPVGPAPAGRSLLNIGAMFSWLALNALIGPALVSAFALVVNGLGGGLFALPSHGWPMLLGALLYIFVADAGEYAAHRLQHVVPWLWSIHSLHHSDRTLNASTAVLNHWASTILHSTVLALLLGVLFKAPAEVTVLYLVSNFYVYFIHANARIEFGPLSWLLTSPSYHRVHHSVEDEHRDCNFAFIFPIYDVVLGTYRPARPGQWPATGLADDEGPRDLIEVVLWPLRGWVRHWRPGRGTPPVVEAAH